MMVTLISTRRCSDGWALVRFRSIGDGNVEAHMLARQGAGGWEGVPLASAREILLAVRALV